MIRTTQVPEHESDMNASAPKQWPCDHDHNRCKGCRPLELNHPTLYLVGQRAGVAIDQETSKGKVEAFVPSRAPFGPNIRARLGDIAVS